MKKRIPEFGSDKNAEDFVETANLADCDMSGFKSAQFEFERKDARINMRVPTVLLKAVKARAQARGIPYQRFIREALEHAIDRSQR